MVIAENIPRPSVITFAVLMENRLQANDHKEGWDECNCEWLFERLREEVDELQRVMGDASDDELFINPEQRTCAAQIVLQYECADVANFAMMLSEQYRKKHT